MGTNIHDLEYRRVIAQAVKRANYKPLPAPSPKEIERALLDQADQWSSEARHWMGLD